MTVCTATRADGTPCPAKARANTDPPRCGRHPTEAIDKTGHEKRQAFLEAYSLIGNVSDASKAAGVARQAHYQWLEQVPGYVDDFHQAREQAADRLEREAVRRAMQGVEKGVYYRGEQVGTERSYSDVLLIFLLKGLRPEKFRDNAVVVANQVNVDRAAPERTPEHEDELAEVLTLVRDQLS